jgi:hypothetical protein
MFPDRRSIQTFAEEHTIELPKCAKGCCYTDIYLDIYQKYSDRALAKWNEEKNNETVERSTWMYLEEDLKEYFNIGN